MNNKENRFIIEQIVKTNKNKYLVIVDETTGVNYLCNPN